MKQKTCLLLPIFVCVQLKRINNRKIKIRNAPKTEKFFQMSCIFMDTIFLLKILMFRNNSIHVQLQMELQMKPKISSYKRFVLLSRVH